MKLPGPCVNDGLSAQIFFVRRHQQFAFENQLKTRRDFAALCSKRARAIGSHLAETTQAIHVRLVQCREHLTTTRFRHRAAV